MFPGQLIGIPFAVPTLLGVQDNVRHLVKLLELPCHGVSVGDMGLEPKGLLLCPGLPPDIERFRKLCHADVLISGSHADFQGMFLGKTQPPGECKGHFRRVFHYFFTQNLLIE